MRRSILLLAVIVFALVGGTAADARGPVTRECRDAPDGRSAVYAIVQGDAVIAWTRQGCTL